MPPRKTRLIPTAQHTTGPFFPAQYIRPADTDLTAGAADGERIALFGRITDALGAPAVNVIVEIWQADAQGRYGTRAFRGWGRTWTDRDGAYRFVTIKPGAYAVRERNRTRAPHITVTLLASGVMRPLVTQVFFPGEPLNADDPQLALVAARLRPRLIAQADAGGYRFDIRLSGTHETPFLED
jgi:protocatechuate 3,4-dioxygenase alpha subunit